MGDGLGRPQEVAAFEAWVRADSTLPVDRDAHGYTDMTTALMWHAWQAAAAVERERSAKLVEEGDVRGHAGHIENSGDLLEALAGCIRRG